MTESLSENLSSIDCIVIPVSAIIPTMNRKEVLSTTLLSLAKQNIQPQEIIIIDASVQGDTETLILSGIAGLRSKIVYRKAVVSGAASQRNEAVTYASQRYVLFMDDDILLEPKCIERLWAAMQSDENTGGVNAMITNQKYSSPGNISRTLFRILNGKKEISYAGKCIGPALNLLPEDRHDLPEIVPVDWLNTTCTIYRKEVLPDPVFTSNFTGYSLMEDLALSLQIGKKWKLMNARTARIYHDSQPGTHKKNVRQLARMELLNRHYIMTEILNRRSAADYFKLLLLQTFGIVTSLTSKKGWINLGPVLFGKLYGIWNITKGK